MAKLGRFPDSGTVIAMRGRVDFYLWKGTPVARAWPRRSTQPRTAGEIASSQRFTWYTKLTGALDPRTAAAWRRMVAGHGHGITWVDGYRAAIGGRPWVR